MHVSPAKWLSLVIALGYVIAFLATAGININVLVICGYLMFPLALIWFPDFLGSMTGYVGRGGLIDAESPGFLVSGFGWFALVGVPVLWYLWGLE